MADKHEHTEGHDGHEGGGHHDIPYFKIYITLIILFLISVAGPEVGELTGLRWITLVTAFGIAFVKANLVIQNFMHLRWEKKLMKWVLVSSVMLMVLMVAGVAPDVMNHEGNNWENLAAKAATARGLGDEHGEEVEGEVVEPVVVAGFSPASSFGIVCATCHGASGMGDGVAGAALDPAPANFTDPVFWETRDRERIITVIRDGAAAVGGSALMAPWGALYTEDQLGEMADYVMSLNPNN